MLHSDTTDFLESQTVILGIYIQLYAPMILNLFITHRMDHAHSTSDPAEKLAQNSLLLSYV